LVKVEMLNIVKVLITKSKIIKVITVKIKMMINMADFGLDIAECKNWRCIN
jgi:hypothetical protein